MSLIQDALKRQQHDSGVGVPKISAPPLQQPSDTEPETEQPAAATPPPLPPSDSAGDGAVEAMETTETAPPPDGRPAAETSSRPWPVLLGLAAVALLILGGVIWGGLYAYQRWQGAKDAAEEAIAEPDESISADEAAPSGPDSTAADSVADPDDPDVEPADSDEELPEPEVTQIEPVQISPTVTQPDVTTPPKTPPATVRPPVDWPLITLTGIVGKGANGSAIINDDIVGVDETIEGVRVISISKRGAELEYEGETRFLKVGGSTE